jgi:hypothetical protein
MKRFEGEVRTEGLRLGRDRRLMRSRSLARTMKLLA